MVFSSQPFSFFAELTICEAGRVGFFELESEEVGGWEEGEVSEEGSEAGEMKRGRPKKVPRRKPIKRAAGRSKLETEDFTLVGRGSVGRFDGSGFDRRVFFSPIT